MKRGLKILGIIVATPVLLFVIAAIMLATVDLNEYREPIAKQISEATGRELTLAGDLEKSFFPWLGVKIGGVELSNASGFKEKTFARLQNAEVRIDTLSLLRMRPAIGKVVVHGLQVNLARRADGTTNWDDLAKTEQAQPKTQPEQAVETESEPDTSKSSDALRDIKVGGIELRDAQLKWDDQQGNAFYEVQDLDLTVSEIELGTPLAVDLAASVKSTEPAMQASIDLSSSEIQWDLDQQDFQFKLLRVGVNATGDTLPGKKVDLDFKSPVTLNIQNQTLSLPAMVIASLGIVIKGEFNARQITSNPVFDGKLDIPSLNPQQLLKTISVDAPQTTDPNVLQQANIKVGFNGDNNRLTVSPIQVSIDDTNINGAVGLNNFAKPEFNFQFDVDAIDIDRYLPPEAKSAPAQPSDGSSTSTTTGAEDPPLPLEPLRALNMNGRLKVGALTASKVETNDLLVTINAKDGLIHLKPVSGKVSGGSFNSDIKLDARGEQLKVAVKETVTNVQVEPLLKALIDNDLLSGAVKLNADISSQGKTTNQLMEALQGVLDFQFNNGAIKGFNLAEYGRQGKALIKGQSYTPSNVPWQTDFTELTGKANIKDGVVDNTVLKGKSPAVRLEGSGKVDLVKQTINYLLTGHVVGTSKGQAGAELSELKGLPIPVRINGSFTELDYDFDERAFRKAFTDKYKKQLKAKEQELKKEFEEKKKAEIEKQKQKLKEELKEEEADLKKKLQEKFKIKF